MIFYVAFTALLIAISSGSSWAQSSDGLETLMKDLKQHDPSVAAGYREAIQNMLKAEVGYTPPQLNAEDAAFLKVALEEIGERHMDSDDEDTIESINSKAGLQTVLYETDILLTKEQSEMLFQSNGTTRGKRAAPMVGNTVRWDKTQPIPYVLDFSLSSMGRAAIHEAIAAWEKGTCLRFQENGSGPNKIRFFAGRGCYSNLGRINRPMQDVSIGSGCESVGTSAHEIGHALGFHHTHVRHDRDCYVVLNIPNVRTDVYRANFEVETTQTNNNYGLPYELGSVMHYNGYSFGVDREQPTIVARNVLYEDTMGNRRPPTVNDLLMMNTHYACTDNCKGRSAPRCKNGGVQNVNNCAMCVCPTGFTGTDCSQRPDQCGAQLQATTEWQPLKFEIGRQGKRGEVEFEECVWWIKGGNGRKVEIQIVGVYGTFTTGCGTGGIEIKAEEDMRMTGYVFCNGYTAPGKTVVSSNQMVPLIAYNNLNQNQFVLKYRLV